MTRWDDHFLAKGRAEEVLKFGLVCSDQVAHAYCVYSIGMQDGSFRSDLIIIYKSALNTAGGNIRSPFFTPHWPGRTLCSNTTKTFTMLQWRHTLAHTPLWVSCDLTDGQWEVVTWPGECWDNRGGMLPGDTRSPSPVGASSNVSLAVVMSFLYQQWFNVVIKCSKLVSAEIMETLRALNPSYDSCSAAKSMRHSTKL